jgi:hyperosmotically inducible protein
LVSKGEQKVRYLYHLLSIVVLTSVLLTSCVSLTGKTAGRNIDDASITASVKTHLAEEKAITLTRINVDTNNGVVSLNGVVDSETTKQRASEIARQTNGVEKVVNNLQVQTAS